MSRIKKNSYITIMSFMVNDLSLKGNALLIYAIIYGFSQAENQAYTGSRQYLADWTNSSKQGIDKVLKQLIANGLIEKSEKEVNGIKFCEYKATYDTTQQNCLVDNKVNRGSQQSCLVDNKVNRGSQQSCLGVANKVVWGSQLSCPNNIDNNIEDNIDIDKDKDKSASQACRDLKLNPITYRLYEEKLFNDLDLMNIEEYNDYIDELIINYPANAVASNAVHIFRYLNERSVRVNDRFNFFKKAIEYNLNSYIEKEANKNNCNEDNDSIMINDIDENKLNLFLEQFE